MLVRNNGFEARLCALEAYIGMTKERRGMTLTGRIDAQHDLLTALSETLSETTRRVTRLEERVIRLEERVTRVEDRLTAIESLLTVLVQDVATVKRLLMPPDDPSGGLALTGSPLPSR